MTPTRTTRIRRALAISSAAAVVAVAAAACGTAYADPRDEAPRDIGHSHDAATTETDHHHDNAASENDSRGDDKDAKDDNEKEDEEGNEKEDERGEQKAELDILGTDCDDSDLDRHDGFQKAPRCVQTSFGEVAAADESPSLLITDAPRKVKANEAFSLVVSTRNLVRDRFLGAAAGGYYAEASFLNDEGIQRGHFHTACRMLESLDAAPDANPEPAFFVATQDNKGGAGEDTVTVDVTGLAERGTAQCAVWAGDGSHRVPMMERANQTPAFDVVRITVE